MLMWSLSWSHVSHIAFAAGAAIHNQSCLSVGDLQLYTPLRACICYQLAEVSTVAFGVPAYNTLYHCCYGVGLPVLPVCLIAHCADDKPADLTVYGNVFVRPRLSSTNTTSGSVTSRRRLLQSGAFCCRCSSSLLVTFNCCLIRFYSA